MSLLTATYLVLMLLGVVWAIYRVRSYVRSQRERESMWDQVMTPEELRAYVENLKREPEAETGSADCESSGEKKTT
jgi:hypothetical protein